MRQKTLDVLEFDKIKSFVANEAISDLGREKVAEMSPATDFETVEFQINETDEISQIYNKHRLPSLSSRKCLAIFQQVHLIHCDESKIKMISYHQKAYLQYPT